MILVRTPYTIPLFGYKTDALENYKLFEGNFIGLTIGKYCNVVATELTGTSSPVDDEQTHLFQHISDQDMIRPRFHHWYELEQNSSLYTLSLVYAYYAWLDKNAHPMLVADTAAQIVSRHSFSAGIGEIYNSTVGGLNHIICNNEHKPTIHPIEHTQAVYEKLWENSAVFRLNRRGYARDGDDVGWNNACAIAALQPLRQGRWLDVAEVLDKQWMGGAHTAGNSEIYTLAKLHGMLGGVMHDDLLFAISKPGQLVNLLHQMKKSGFIHIDGVVRKRGLGVGIRYADRN